MTFLNYSSFNYSPESGSASFPGAPASKRVLSVQPPSAPHWVGDGFPVRTLFSYDGLGKELNPFLLLDYAGPVVFPPAPPSRPEPRGVGAHPHRGFETVTIVYSGEVAHGDSAGHGGVIGPGDVQWMTAGSGVLHQEYHSPAFSATGGAFEMAQLWINLPASRKMTAPAYQPLLEAAIPAFALSGKVGTIRAIAGQASLPQAARQEASIQKVTGPASTFSPLSVWDVRLKGGETVSLTRPNGWITAIAVLRGRVVVNGAQAGAAQTVVLSRDGETFEIEAQTGGTSPEQEEALFLVLAALPLDEPVVGHGPFVMNEQREILEAIQDFRAGRFGSL